MLFSWKDIITTRISLSDTLPYNDIDANEYFFTNGIAARIGKAMVLNWGDRLQKSTP